MRGGGLSWADSAIKSQPKVYGLSNDQLEALGEIKDLSCRWQPINSARGKILSILVRSSTDDIQIFERIISEFTSLLEGDIGRSNPVNLEVMKYKSLWATFRSEFKLHAKHFNKGYFTRLFWAAFSVWSFKGRRVKPFDTQTYSRSLPAHSDFRKFDDMLRLVIDCKPSQVLKIHTYLETLHHEGRVYFGIHESDHAIMTCLVGTTNEGEHIHFIDGGAGGYAMAAKTLKEQMAMASSQDVTA